MDRGQAHTLEAFTAAILLVAGLLFASQATAVTPLSASTSNQHVQTQHRAMANDLLETGADNGDLESAIVAWNDTDERSSDPGETVAFITAMNGILGERNVAYNLEVRWWEDSTATDRSSAEIITMGTPSDDAVLATRLVPMYSADVNSDEFYIDDAGGDFQTVYNVVEVRLVVWKT